METAQTENNTAGGLSELTAGLEASDEQRPTPLEIADWLMSLAEEMDAISIVMDYYGGFSEWAKHGREIAGAGAIARQWADEIVASNAALMPRAECESRLEGTVMQQEDEHG